MTRILPIIIGGGKGTRLWPQSRAESPKQFHKVRTDDALTLFQDTVSRHTGEAFLDPLCLIGIDQLPLVRRQIAEIGATARYLMEPVSRNTGPALAAAALLISEDNPEQILLTLPADHVVGPRFTDAVHAGVEAVEHGRLVTFGIKPDSPATGFGYIRPGPQLNGTSGINTVLGFVEKPQVDIAIELIRDDARWASGIGLYRACDFLAMFEQQAPDILHLARLALRDAKRSSDGRETLLAGHYYEMCRSVSTEEAVLQRCPERLATIDATDVWDDVGSWDAYHRLGPKDESGNVAMGDVQLHGVRNSYVRSENRLVAVAGVKDVCIIDTPDALLVIGMDHSQDVKKIVETLTLAERGEVVKHRKRHDAWGFRSSLRGSGPPFDELSILAGYSMPLEASDTFRTLVCLSGTLRIVEDDGVEYLEAGGSMIVAPSTTLEVGNHASDEALAILVDVRIAAAGLGTEVSLGIVPEAALA